MTRDPQPDVLIVGAGPTGLALAAQLHASGATVRLVDRQPERARESRALAIQPRTLEVLQPLGLAQQLIERGNDAVKLRIHAGERIIPVPLFDAGFRDTAYPFLLFLSQAETETVIGEHLAARGVHVERGAELVAFATNDERVTCTVRHQDGFEEHVHARYLVGCDGPRSTVRHGAQIPFTGRAYPQTFLLADLEVDGELERDTVHAYIAAAGMLFFFPLGRPASWRMLGMQPNSTATAREQQPPELSLEDAQALADSFTGGPLRLRDPVWVSEFKVHLRQATRYRAGRVFLAGDAAHVHSPAGAQGMNTGIQDACNLGWKLALAARGRADEQLLDSYHEERWPVGRDVLRFTNRPFSIATSQRTSVRLLRAHIAPRLVPLVQHLRPLRTYGLRAMSQLDIRYRHSPTVEEGRPTLRAGPQAGDRLPDGSIVRDGQRCWLHEALAGPRFHILLCGLLDAWDADRLAALREHFADLIDTHHLSRQPDPGALLDRDGNVLRRLGITHTGQYLIRPDHHIAYRSAGTDTTELAGYLARWHHGTGRADGRSFRA